MSPAVVSDKIERTIELKAPPERVWRALTTEKEFSEWFGVEFLEGGLKPGGRNKLRSTHAGYEHIEFYLQVERMEPGKCFSWRWIPGSEQQQNEARTLVEFRLEATPTGTRLTVTESGFDQLSREYRAKAFADNSEGWRIQLESLEKYLARQK